MLSSASVPVKRLVRPVTSSSRPDVAEPLPCDCASAIRRTPFQKETPKTTNDLSGRMRPIRHCDQSEAIQTKGLQPRLSLGCFAVARNDGRLDSSSAEEPKFSVAARHASLEPGIQAAPSMTIPWTSPLDARVEPGYDGQQARLLRYAPDFQIVP